MSKRGKKVIASVMESLEFRRLLAAITVNSTADTLTPNDGEVTLREAITAINAGNDLGDPDITAQNPGAFGANDTIDFNIAGTGVQTISPNSALPTLFKPMNIDGYSQSGASANTLATGDNAKILIRLDGSAAGATGGLVIDSASGGGGVRGLAITGFELAAIDIETGTGSILAGNFLGLDPDGSTADGNFTYGVAVDADGNTVGGSSPADRNLISANFGGILVAANSTLIQGNYVGTDATGAIARGNSDQGISVVNGSQNTVTDNVISGNGKNGVLIEAIGAGNVVRANFIGTDASGTKALGNQANGIAIFGSTNLAEPLTSATIGGPGAGDGNVISGNAADGILIENSQAQNSTIQGNYIGTNADGNAAVPDSIGIFLDSARNNLIGGATPGAGNVISGNRSAALVLGDQSSGNTVQGNLIGVNAAGNAALGNGGTGISLSSSDSNLIGGTAAGAGNIVAANSGGGIDIDFSNLNRVQGNLIGVLPDRVTPAGNEFYGLDIADDSQRNEIGGSVPAAGNIIANTFGPVSSGGILLISAAGNPLNNPIRFNSIYNNTGLGIDFQIDTLGTDFGVTPNDPGDADTGPNHAQNFPVLTTATSNGTSLTITGNLNSLPNTFFTLDFYVNDTVDPSGNGEGKQYIGSVGVTTDALGNATFTAAFTAAIGNNKFIAATATNELTSPYGDTSEFSADVQATVINPPPPPVLSISDVSMNEGNSGTTSFTFTVTRTGDLSGTSTVAYATADGTATTADNDYQPTSNTLTFAPGEATKTLTVLVNGDTKVEPDETFTVNLSSPTGATLATSTATGTILNDDTAPAEAPFGGTTPSLVGTHQAEDFDTGGEGVAYHDTDAANLGGKYRPTEGIDIESTTDAGGGFDVGWAHAGEYLKYTLAAASSDTYSLSLRVANVGSGATLHVELDGNPVTGELSVPNTGNFQTYATINAGNIPVTAGTHIIKIVFDSNAPSGFAGNANYFTFAAPTPTPTPTPTSSPFGGTPANLPGTIQAENYDTGGEGAAFHDTDSTNLGGKYRTGAGDSVDVESGGSGFAVDYTHAGEWLKYTVNVTATGNYTFDARLANYGAGATFHVEVDGVDVTGSLAVTNTNSFAIYADVTKANIHLTAGTHVVRFVWDTNSVHGFAGNLDFFKFT